MAPNATRIAPLIEKLQVSSNAVTDDGRNRS
jgi:hypothetical protein